MRNHNLNEHGIKNAAPDDSKEKLKFLKLALKKKVKFRFKYTRLDIRKHRFTRTSRVIPLWNDLPSECVDCSLLCAF